MGSQLIAVLSPAKRLDSKTHFPDLPCSHPAFLKEAEYLVTKLRKCNTEKLSLMMGISADLAMLNKERFAAWHIPFSHNNAIQSVLMFKGDVYRGIRAETFSKKDLAFAQDHLRILSGLYGLLRPLDLIQPYRLMMGTPFSPDTKSKNLYSFWGNKLSSMLSSELAPRGVLINLASSEYFKSLQMRG
ncbi:MAG: YaaA family protein, partial [Crocinitomicaceae bacterium]|nr:YaaA family protein [Crocinitomicaceae bacterium]